MRIRPRIRIRPGKRFQNIQQLASVEMVARVLCFVAVETVEELDVVEGGFGVAVDGADVRYATAEGFELPVDVVFVREIPAMFGGVKFEVR